MPNPDRSRLSLSAELATELDRRLERHRADPRPDSMTPEAAADLERACRAEEAEAAGSGEALMRAVRDALALVNRRPEQFARAHGDIRRALVSRLPYAMYYVVEGKRTTVVGVMHHRDHARRRTSRR